ncbi:MAG: SDR family NAD(P)-dependent oxidoreductase [Phycisphaerae bacterium]|nr:SDR family NAD(P)-dependent oxidoreductase [Phycisphaerae bacterium]
MKLPVDAVDRLRGPYDKAPVCITGGAGFIGGHLADALLSLGATITVIDDLSSSTLDHLADLIELEPDRVRFVHGSILDDAAVADAMEGARIVFHLAAMGSVPRSIAEPQRTWSVNATGTVRMLEAARREWSAGAPGSRFVLAASSSAYGDDTTLPKHEGLSPRPLSPYAASKLAAEHAVTAWCRAYRLSGVNLRYFNVFGPRQPADSQYAAVIPAFTRRLLAGQPPVIHGDGTQSRDFTSVANAVLATLLAGVAPAPLAGEVMNVGAGRATTLLELAAMLAQRCGVPGLQPMFGPPRPGDVPHSLADISRARQLIGYEPFATLEAGLDETVAWFKRSMAGAGA